MILNVPMLIWSLYIWASVAQLSWKWHTSREALMGLMFLWLSLAPIFALIAIMAKSEKSDAN